MKSLHTNFNLVLLSLTISIITFSFLVYICITPSQNIAYMVNDEVFNNFTMTKELNKIATAEIKKRQIAIDSLYSVLNDPANKESKELLMQNILAKKKEGEEFAENFSIQETTKIWGRISSYAVEFSKAKGYDIVLGSQPDANIIYGNENKNVTEDFIKYINNKYEGNK